MAVGVDQPCVRCRQHPAVILLAAADAISAVGAVLEHYDTDRMFPAFGFGAALPPAGTVSHCFALNGTPSNPEVAGVKSIQDVYRHTLSSVRLSGPTLFAPVINAASQVSMLCLLVSYTHEGRAAQAMPQSVSSRRLQAHIQCTLVASPTCAARVSALFPSRVLGAAHPHRRVSRVCPVGCCAPSRAAVTPLRCI